MADDEPTKIRPNFDSVVDSSSGDQTLAAVVNLPLKKRRLSSDEANNIQSVVVGDDAKIPPEKIAGGGTPSAINGGIPEAAKLQIDRNPAEMKTTDDTSIIILEQLLHMKNIIDNYTKHTQANDSGPGSRYFTNEDKCLSKQLTSVDRCSLHIDYFDALVLTNDPDIGLCSPGSFKRKNTMTVFDGANRKYTMVLSMHKITQKSEYFTLGGDWEKFVVANKLKPGDEITMYHLNPKEKSYVVKYFRKPADRVVSENATNMKKIASAAPSNPLEPAGSRYFTNEDKCLSKQLTSADWCSLHIDYFDALILTNDPDIGLCSPGSFKRKNTITVFDGANRKYAMVLSMHKITGRKTEYFTLGGDWEKFIVANKLKPGDEVTMYHLDRKKKSYVVKYFRKPADRYVPENVTNMKKIGAAYEEENHEAKKIASAAPSNPLEPAGSRYFAIEDKCLSKKLTSADRCSLHIDYFDALILTNDPDIGHCSPGSFKRKSMMTVLDGANRKYTMVLSMHKITGRGKLEYFTLGGDWEKFVVANKLKPGDEVTMYHLDRNKKSYVVKYFRKPADLCVPENVTNMKKTGAAYEENREAKKIASAAPSNPLEPASSRNYRTEEPTLSKKLSSFDVIKQNAVLNLDYYEAVLLTEDDDMNHDNKILVYDEAEIKYYMVVSKKENSGGRVRYELGGDWKRFVRAHDLKAGDEVLFHEIDEEDSIGDENRFVLRYNRKPT